MIRYDISHRKIKSLPQNKFDWNKTSLVLKVVCLKSAAGNVLTNKM